MCRTRLAACLLIAAAAPLVGCGGGDDDKTGKAQLSQAGDRQGAEDTVRDYLRALVNKDGDAACAKLTPAYRRSVLEQNAEFAKKQHAKTCGELIDAVTRESRTVTFEGQPLNSRTVGKIKLVVSLRQGGEEQNATVAGTQGLQRYELITGDGKWLIEEIEQAG